MRHSPLFLLLAAASATAAPQAGVPDLQPTVQVTASRVSETVDSALADVTVLTRRDIEASVARDALDLLRLQAGIDLYRTGGPGAQTSLFLRGTNANHALVLIDGVRVAAATTGAFAFEHLPLDAIERIEIVRGPRASYWGSDAIGGVIQIFTRRQQGAQLGAGYGSWKDRTGTAGYGQWDGPTGLGVHVGSRDIRGFPATSEALCAGPDDPHCIHDPDADGYRNLHASLRAGVQLGGQVLSALAYRSQGRAEFGQGWSDFAEQVGGLDLEGALGTDWNHRLALGAATEDLATPAFSSEYRTRRSSLLWQNDLRIGSNQRLVAGVDLIHEQASVRDTFANLDRYRQSRNNRAVFAGLLHSAGSVDAEASLRHDRNSAFGSATTGALAGGWRLSPATRLRASWGQGFRSPSTNELYDPGYDGWFAGNPALQPERSRSSELGLEFTPPGAHQFGLNLWSTHVGNLVSFTGPLNRAENIARARIEGAELAWRFHAGTWSVSANWTWQDARDATTGEALLRRARNKANAVIEHAHGEHLRLGAELVHAGKRPDVGGEHLGAYTLLNLRASVAVAPAWSLRLRGENLTDRNYELVQGYNTPGRSGFLEIVWEPGR